MVEVEPQLVYVIIYLLGQHPGFCRMCSGALQQSSLTLCVCLFEEKRKGGALPVSMAEEYRTGKGGIVRVSFFFFLREGGEGERWVRHF